LVDRFPPKSMLN
jgi:hypothetical protein